MAKSSIIAKGVQEFVELHRIGRILADRTQLVDLLDSSKPLQRGVMPPSFHTEPNIMTGYRYLEEAKPKVVVILTMHRNGNDFEDLLKVAGQSLQRSPVSGVEAKAMTPPNMRTLAAPRLEQDNLGLRAFQESQFPWHRQHKKHMLPSEVFFVGELGKRFDELVKLFKALKVSAQGYSDEARQQIMRLLYAQISLHRTWGIPGQLSWWLQHPLVQKIIAGWTDYTPLTLGRAHKYQAEILKSRGASVELVDIVAHLDTDDARQCLADSSAGLFRREVSTGHVLHSELKARRFTYT